MAEGSSSMRGIIECVNALGLNLKGIFDVARAHALPDCLIAQLWHRTGTLRTVIAIDHKGFVATRA